MEADIYKRELIIPYLLDEATSIGAALTGGVGIGLYNGFSFANKMFKIKEILKPNKKNNAIYNKLYKLFKEVYISLEPNFKIMEK